MRDASRNGRRLAQRMRLPEPWCVEDFCAHVADMRRRKILILDHPAQGDSITAAVMSTATVDYIFCRDDLKGLHRDHAICHEIGHLVAGHTEGGTSADALATGLEVFNRTSFNRDCSYGDRREQEAEVFADTVMDRVSQRMRGPEDDTNRRIRRGFGSALR